MLKTPFSRRRLLAFMTKRIAPVVAWGIPTFISAWSLRLQMKDADRQQGRIVQLQGTGHSHSSAHASLSVITVRADQKGYLPTSRASITVGPTIPI
jgi:hypothetical protein